MVTLEVEFLGEIQQATVVNSKIKTDLGLLAQHPLTCCLIIMVVE